MTQDMLELIKVVLPLAGVALGGVITFLVTRSTEREKARRERRQKLAQLEQDALARALEWIDPMRNAHIRISSLLSASSNGSIDRDHVTKHWPDLLGQLAKLDVPTHQRAVLFQDVYPTGRKIAADLDDLKSVAIRQAEAASASLGPRTSFDEWTQQIHDLDNRIEKLEHKLRARFRATFD